MAIDLTGTDDESEDQAGHHPDPDQHSMPETADRAPDSEPVTPTASPAAGGFSNEDWQGELEQSLPEWHTPHPNTGYLDNIDRAGSPSVSPCADATPEHGCMGTCTHGCTVTIGVHSDTTVHTDQSSSTTVKPTGHSTRTDTGVCTIQWSNRHKVTS